VGGGIFIYFYFYFIFFYIQIFDFAARCVQLRSIGRLDDSSVVVESLGSLVYLQSPLGGAQGVLQSFGGRVLLRVARG
jgi:hypothetical protein